MKNRLRRIASILLASAVSFSLGVSSVPAATLFDDGFRWENAEPGKEVKAGGWTIKDDVASNHITYSETENGDGDMITLAYTNREADHTELLVKGDRNSKLLILYGLGTGTGNFLSDSDRITLDVNLDGAEMDGPVEVHIPVKCFQTDEDYNLDDEGIVDKVINIKENPGTCWESDYYQAEDDDEGEDKPCFVFKFYSTASRKKCNAGGWTVEDSNVEGDLNSYVTGDEYEDGVGCRIELTCPESAGKPVNAVIKGTTDSEDLDFSVWGEEYMEEEEIAIDLRRMSVSLNDRILIDVTKPENAKSGDSVSIFIYRRNLEEGMEDNEEYLKQIFTIKDNPGIKYEIIKDTYEDDEGNPVDPYWEIIFKVASDQDNKNDIAGNERKAEDGTTTERSQALGDTLKINSKKSGKKQVFSLPSLKEKKGAQNLTVNAGAKLMAEDLKGYDRSKATVSFNNPDGTFKDGSAKDVKRLFKINKKGQITLKADKTYASYTLKIPLEECILYLKVVNVGFDKNSFKNKKITALTGDYSTVSINLVQFIGKKAQSAESEFLSADWYVDGKTPVNTTDANNPVVSKKKLNVYLSPDYRTITIANPGTVKSGNVKIMAKINGRKYSGTVKVRVK